MLARMKFSCKRSFSFCEMEQNTVGEPCQNCHWNMISILLMVAKAVLKKLFTSKSQAYGFSPVCILRWLSMRTLDRYCLPQKSQTNAFSLVCVIM